MSETDILIKKNTILKLNNNRLKKQLDLYKSIFKTHSNSVIFQLSLKKKNGIPVWVDKIRDNRDFIKSLDMDDEIEEWLKPVKCER
jgi:hypothetical protein